MANNLFDTCQSQFYAVSGAVPQYFSCSKFLPPSPAASSGCVNCVINISKSTFSNCSVTMSSDLCASASTVGGAIRVVATLASQSLCQSCTSSSQALSLLVQSSIFTNCSSNLTCASASNVGYAAGGALSVILFSSAAAASSVLIQDSSFSGCSASCGPNTFVPVLGGAVFILGASSLSIINITVCGGGIRGDPATLSASSGGGAIVTAAVPVLSFDTVSLCSSTVDQSGNAQFFYINASGFPLLQLTIIRSSFSGFYSSAISIVRSQRVNLNLQEVTFYAADIGINFIQSRPPPSVTFSGRDSVLYCPAGAYVSIFNSTRNGFAITCNLCRTQEVALTNSWIDLDVLQSHATQVLLLLDFPRRISHVVTAIHASRPRFIGQLPCSSSVRFWNRQLQYNNQRFIGLLGCCCIRSAIQTR